MLYRLLVGAIELTSFVVLLHRFIVLSSDLRPL
jgi:hypothetical protein